MIAIFRGRGVNEVNRSHNATIGTMYVKLISAIKLRSAIFSSAFSGSAKVLFNTDATASKQYRHFV